MIILAPWLELFIFSCDCGGSFHLIVIAVSFSHTLSLVFTILCIAHIFFPQPCTMFELLTVSCPLFHSSFFSPFIIIMQRVVGFFLSLFLSLPRSFLTSTDKENMFTLDHFPVWYRRAAENPAGQFLYYMPRQETKGRGHKFIESTYSYTHKHTHAHTHAQTLYAQILLC